MSYRCQECFEVSEKGEDCYKLVTQTRPRFYEQKIKVQKEDTEFEKIKRSQGWEIVTEKKLCRKCYNFLKEKHGNTCR